HEKSNFTVILACMANGTKLPAVCIFKLKNISRVSFPQEIHIHVNEKGWCNKQEMIWWIENVWTQRNPL
ncbi:17428_t:CDS:1, partial [Funneliformis caledonium]